MHGNVTNEEWQIFKEAYQYFSDYCMPPANQDENAADWWMSAAKDVGELDQKWKDYPLMRSLLLAIYEYINKRLRNRLKDGLSKKGTLRNGFIKEKYGKSKQMRFLHGRPVIPLGYVQLKNAQHKRKCTNSVITCETAAKCLI